MNDFPAQIVLLLDIGWHIELTPKVAAHPIFLEIIEILKLDNTKMSQWVDVPLAVSPLPRVAHTCQSLKM